MRRLTADHHLDAWEARLAAAADRRRRAGAFQTPPALVERLLDDTLAPCIDAALARPDAAAALAAIRVLDPSVGGGRFLLAAGRRLAAAHARLGAPHPFRAAAPSLHGVDADPEAVAVARAALEAEAGGPLPGLALRVGDALTGPAPALGPEPVPAGAPPPGALDWAAAFPAALAAGGFDVVVGNPPYLNQLERRTTLDPAAAAALRTRFPGLVRPYTDPAALLLVRSLALARPGGRVGLVLPQATLAAQHAAPVRALVARHARLDALWAPGVPVFPDAQVLVVTLAATRGAPQGPLRRAAGRAATPLDPLPLGPGALDAAPTWSALLLDERTAPRLRLAASGTVGDLATATADFRDAYYGLAALVEEAGDDPGWLKVVTTGLVDPARLTWGARPARLGGRPWSRPGVRAERLATSPLAAWAPRRLVPKVLVATQTRVIEALADPEGTLLPVTPLISVVPAPGELWPLAAVLLAPAVSRQAVERFGGAALSATALKLAARQVAELPLPADRAAWADAADAVARAHRAGDPASRLACLTEAARCMNAAFRVDDPEALLAWWLARLPEAR